MAGVCGERPCAMISPAIAPKVVNLNDLVVSLDTILRRLIGEHIELVVLPAEGLYSVQVDPGQFDVTHPDNIGSLTRRRSP